MPQPLENVAARRTASGQWISSDEDKTVATFDTSGAGVAGAVAPTFGTDGTVYVATGSGDSPVANAIVSLEPRTLKQRDWFTAPTPFMSAPVVFQSKGKDMIVARQQGWPALPVGQRIDGGRRSQHRALQDGPDHVGRAGCAGLGSWVDAAGTRWIVATIGGPVAADDGFAMNNGAVDDRRARGVHGRRHGMTYRRCSRSGCRAKSRAP